MNEKEAWFVKTLIEGINTEYKLNQKGATNSAIYDYARGSEIPIMKVDRILDVLIRAGIIHQKIIGKRYYYRLGRESKDV